MGPAVEVVDRKIIFTCNKCGNRIGNQGSTLPTNIVNVIKSSMELKKTPDSLVNVEEIAVSLSSLSLSVKLHPVPQEEDENVENNKEEEKEASENEGTSIETSEKTCEHYPSAENLKNKPDPAAGKAVIAELKQLAKSGQPMLKDRFKYGEDYQNVVNPGLDKTAVSSTGMGKEETETTSLNFIDYTVKSHYYKGSLKSGYADTAIEEGVVSDNSNVLGNSKDEMGNSNSDNAQASAETEQGDTNKRLETEQGDTNKRQSPGINGDDLVVHETNLNVKHIENARRQAQLMAEMEKELMLSEKKRSKACVIV